MYKKWEAMAAAWETTPPRELGMALAIASQRAEAEEEYRKALMARFAAMSGLTNEATYARFELARSKLVAAGGTP